jgi:hypothetical protein
MIVMTTLSIAGLYKVRDLPASIDYKKVRCTFLPKSDLLDTQILFTARYLLASQVQRTSIQDTHSSFSPTISNRYPRVDIKPQFSHVYNFGNVSVMISSGGELYGCPRRCKSTVL